MEENKSQEGSLVSMETEENKDMNSNTTQATYTSGDSYEDSTVPKRKRSSKQKKMSFSEKVMLKKQKLDSFLRDRKQWDINYFSTNIKPLIQTLHHRNPTAGVTLAPLRHVPNKVKRLSEDGAVERAYPIEKCDTQSQPLQKNSGTIVKFAHQRGKARGDDDYKSSKSETVRLKVLPTSKEGSSQDAESRNIASVPIERTRESKLVPKTDDDSVMARNRADVFPREVLNGHASTTVHRHEAQRSRRGRLSTLALQTSPSSGSSQTENSHSVLSKQSDYSTETTDKTDSDGGHTRVRFLLDENSLVRGYTFFRGNTQLTKEDLENFTFRPQINDKRIINKTYTGEDTYYMALESARLKRGSSEIERDNLYRSIQHIPPHRRRNYMLGRPQAKQYRYIQDIYGKCEKDKRARQFFEKLEEVQKEDFRNRLEELIEREKLKMETKERHREQLAFLRQKFEDDAWKRFMTQYVTSRVLAHEHMNRHVYGLPEDLDGEPEFEARLKRKRLLPKTDTLSKKNKKKYQQMFEVKMGPTWQTNDPPPKLEGIDSVYFEDEDEKGKPLGKRRNVNEILEEAQAMLRIAEEELNDSMPSSLENSPKKEKSYPRRTETKRAEHSWGSSPDQYVYRVSPKTKKTEEKESSRGAKRQFAAYPRDITASNSPNRAKEGKSELPYINVKQQKDGDTGHENHKSHVLSSREKKRSVKIEIPTSSSNRHLYQPTSRDYVKQSSIYDTEQRENDQNLPNRKQQNNGIMKSNDPQPEREVIVPTKTLSIDKRNDSVPQKNEEISRVSPTTVRKDKRRDSASQNKDKQDRHNPVMPSPKEDVQLTYFKDPASSDVPIPSLKQQQQKQHRLTTEDSDEDDKVVQNVNIKKINTTKTATTSQETKPTPKPNAHEMMGNYSNTGKEQQTVNSKEQSENRSNFNGHEQQSTRFNNPTIKHDTYDLRGTMHQQHPLPMNPNTSENDESIKKTVTKVTTTKPRDVPKDSDKGKSNQTVKSKVETKPETKADKKDYEELISSKRISKKKIGDVKNSQKESENVRTKIPSGIIKTKTSGQSKKGNNSEKAEASSTEKNDWRVSLDKYLANPGTGIDRTDERSLLSTKINDDDDDDMSDIFERARRRYNLDIDEDDDDD